MCLYVKSLLRDPRPLRRVSVSLFASRFSPLGPCAKDSRRAFAARRAGVTSAKRVFQRSRSEKRPGTVTLSTSSRSRHNLPILYVYTLFLSNAILSSFVTFRFVCMCVSFFFSCVYLPLKVAGGCTARISLKRFRDLSSRLFARSTDVFSTVPRSAVPTSRIKTHFTLLRLNAAARRIAPPDNFSFLIVAVIRAYA